MEKLYSAREHKAQKDFDEAFEKYKEAVKAMSGGLVETSKAEFIKFAAFSQVVINPAFDQVFDAFKKTNRKG